jgi:NAD+ synthase
MEKINNVEGVAKHIVEWLKGYVEKSGAKGFTIGVSGGIDSAVTSTLCAKTGYPVIAVEMPIHQSEDQVNRAQDHINWLKENYKNVSDVRVDLTDTYETFANLLNLEGNKKLALANTRSRLRMVSLYAIANDKGYLVCGTGNKVEDIGIKFFSKYGDGGVDISPIGDLLKSEVYLLGEHMGIIDEILSCEPSDGLWTGMGEGSQTDEQQIGASYDELEWAMDFYEKNWYWEQGMENEGFLDYDFEKNSTIVGSDPVGLSDREKEVLKIYINRHNAGKHKMEMPPICSIPSDLKN